jgi:hypothetical protein
LVIPVFRTRPAAAVAATGCYAGLDALEVHAMPDGLWPVLILLAFVLIYVVAKIREYMKVSEEQWKKVDKSELREWEDDEDE